MSKFSYFDDDMRRRGQQYERNVLAPEMDKRWRQEDILNKQIKEVEDRGHQAAAYQTQTWSMNNHLVQQELKN